MAVTELIFVTYNTDPKLQADLKQKAPELFSYFSGVEGLQSISRGKVLADDGTSVDLDSGRSNLVLEWDQASYFHAFYPNGPRFQKFAGLMKPYVASVVGPELFEASASSTPCVSSNITQIIKVTQSPDTEKIWNQIQETISQSNTEIPKFFHGSGIDGQEGIFLAMIGWQSFEAYEESRKDATIVKLIGELGSAGKVCDLAVDLASIKI